MTIPWTTALDMVHMSQVLSPLSSRATSMASLDLHPGQSSARTECGVAHQHLPMRLSLWHLLVPSRMGQISSPTRMATPQAGRRTYALPSSRASLILAFQSSFPRVMTVARVCSMLPRQQREAVLRAQERFLIHNILPSLHKVPTQPIPTLLPTAPPTLVS